MPFWPLYMVAAFVLTIWGYRAGAWVAPVLMLAGLFGMRVIAWMIDPALHAVAACTLWLFIAVVLVHKRAWLPAVFLALSGMSYGIFWLAGFEYGVFSIMPIVADLFWWLALLSVGGGLLAASGHYSRSGAGLRDWFAVAALGVAARQARNSVTVAKHPKMIYDAQ